MPMENALEPPKNVPVPAKPEAKTTSFSDYFTEHIDYIKSVQALLAEPLDDSPINADQQARKIESHGARILSILAWSNAYLDIAEHLRLREMPERNAKSFTDLDRQKALAAAVVRVRRFRDVVEGLSKAIERRISYVQSMLKYAGAEHQRFQT